MLSFDLAGGVEAVRRFVKALEVFTLAEFRGGVESLIAHPATMTHAGMGEEARQAAGIGDGLLRLSVWLERDLAALDAWIEALHRQWGLAIVMDDFSPNLAIGGTCSASMAANWNTLPSSQPPVWPDLSR